MDLDPIPANEDLLDPVVQPDVEGGKSEVGEEGDVGESLVETPAEAGDDDDLRGIQLDGALDGELQVGLIFIVRE